ncbi:bifunctional protein tyrosine phosphatase family protein/NAD(P)/FAD-dependent oxidoreductase [Methylophilus aquaticus]|uniref:TIGR01244 family sulfur transferase n=1 Tax=Methylophilus aquaticus TaxID=1971610 RepID=A0ABT9JWG6_9PROT|nr:bifunctional protein tyrosine phosphatase family protein/NAD(P)/FAD-dependent oxidoreductase [Methylophilus aquaticus]MDP8568866.1 TIGR01244 family sulfur transferase [Methylophilus aquaticus]
MKTGKINQEISVADQLLVSDLPSLAAQGFKSIFCHRPDGEGPDQPSFHEIDVAAKALGLHTAYLPVTSGKVSDEDVAAFASQFQHAPKPVLAYCRSGMRAITLWSLQAAASTPLPELLSIGQQAGYDLSGLTLRLAAGKQGGEVPVSHYTVVIIGGGAAGIAAASSLLSRDPSLEIALIDPAETHYYQPGWTLVGGGVFSAESTVKTMASVIPAGVKWIKAAVAGFDPQQDRVILEGCRLVSYEKLIVCPGIKLNWGAIEGLNETLGRNGVTSNYRYDLAPYTWELVSQLKHGKAVFTQPPMPIKCAGAPQKAMYLSGDHWWRSGVLNDIQIDFYNAGAVLFGVKEYVPALMQYVEKYHSHLHFSHRLTKVDGQAKRAWFAHTLADGSVQEVETDFDLLHVVPPQHTPDFIRVSPLADTTGWIDVNPDTLQHKHFPNIYALGDAANSPNAKTAAAARKQAPVVATNLLFDLRRGQKRAAYDGYGSCPLTVERGKVVLAEFGYGGRLLPSFPQWLLNGQQPSRLAWILKERLLPPIYWKGMLKGHEWLATPQDVARQEQA